MAFRLKAIAELEEEEALSAVSHLQQQQAPRQTWGEWLLRRDPADAGEYRCHRVSRTRNVLHCALSYM